MTVILMVLGALIGAGVMYVLDPDQGRRRRALIRDQVVSKSNKAGDELEAKAGHMRNKAQGVVAEARGAIEDQKERITEESNQRLNR
jgi:hypothetical protein